MGEIPDRQQIEQLFWRWWHHKRVVGQYEAAAFHAGYAAAHEALRARSAEHQPPTEHPNG